MHQARCWDHRRSKRETATPKWQACAGPGQHRSCCECRRAQPKTSASYLSYLRGLGKACMPIRPPAELKKAGPRALSTAGAMQRIRAPRASDGNWQGEGEGGGGTGTSGGWGTYACTGRMQAG